MQFQQYKQKMPLTHSDAKMSHRSLELRNWSAANLCQWYMAKYIDKIYCNLDTLWTYHTQQAFLTLLAVSLVVVVVSFISNRTQQ